jgi:hypothetical protein
MITPVDGNVEMMLMKSSTEAEMKRLGRVRRMLMYLVRHDDQEKEFP